MIAVVHEATRRMEKLLSTDGDVELGFHRRYGWITDAQLHLKLDKWKSNADKFKRESNRWLFRFRWQAGAEIQVLPIQGCDIRKLRDHWALNTELGEFSILQTVPPTAAHAPLIAELPAFRFEDQKSERRIAAAILALLLLFIGLQHWAPSETKIEESMAPTTLVQIPIKKIQAVTLPASVAKNLTQQAAVDQRVHRAVQQELGFLGLIGKSNLNKALGGLPTDLKQASPGAGPGGTEGSGGEVLVGLGKGVVRTTVGNSGMHGLGGIGTKGRGGGQGGYGNTSVGSGEGKGLSTLPISNDMVLEGGLDRYVIQATIAKYLSQIRACYEKGLEKNSALQGEVPVFFEVNATGALNFARVEKSSLGDAAVESCMTQRMMGWAFPKPRGGVTVRVKYPFLLRPTSS